jgi:hypothetical protein
MKTSKKLREVFENIRPHINGHVTVINQFIEAINEVEEMEALSQHDVSGECVHNYQLNTLKNDILCTKCGLSKYLD